MQESETYFSSIFFPCDSRFKGLGFVTDQKSVTLSVDFSNPQNIILSMDFVVVEAAGVF